MKRFPGFRSRSIAGVRLRSPSGNGYAAPPIPAALGAVKVLLALPFFSLANPTVRACAHRSRLELCCKNQGLGLSTVLRDMHRQQSFALLHGGV